MAPHHHRQWHPHSTGIRHGRFSITNTIVSGNGSNGIQYSRPSGSPNANDTVDHVTARRNGFFGIAINPLNTTGGATLVSTSNSIVSNNVGGISAESSGAVLTVSDRNPEQHVAEYILCLQGQPD